MIIKNGSYTVYVLTNTINGRMYVGATRREPRQRFNYGQGYRNQKLFYRDICDFGWKNFSYEIFASNLTEEEAFNMEKLLILKVREQDPNLLYNRDAGGKRGKHCEETKEIIREANMGKIVSEETKQKIRIARAKQVISHESIMKTAEKNRGRKMSPELCKKIGERSSKAVRCIENNTAYSSMKEAAEDLHVSISGISQHINGKYSHVKGLHFEYV